MPTISAISAAPATIPVQMQSLAVAQPSTIAIASTGCSSQSSISSTPSLADLMALKIKAQELESRATTAMLQSMKDSMQMQQAALSTLRPSGTDSTGQSSLSSLPSGQDTTASRVNNLIQIVDRLSKRLDDVVNHLQQQKK
jgi:hypothetical protein